MYATPKRLRHAGLGMNLSGLTDLDLRTMLVGAASRIDAYCNVPMLPQKFSFRGGQMVGEKHGWTDSQSRRIYLSAFPIRSVENVRIDATNELYIEFEPEDFYINYAEGYIELINFALTKVGIWGEANVPHLGLAQPVSLTDYTYGYRYEVVDELAFDMPTVSGETEPYQEYLAEFGYWADDVDPVIKKNGSIESSGFTVDNETGLVRFDTPLTSGDEVRLSYTYTLPGEIAMANSFIMGALLGERSLQAKGLAGIESIEIEEVRIRRIGSRSGAEKGVDVPLSAANLLDGFRFWTAR